MPFLTELFPRVQFIVATHSPAVIASIPRAVVCDLGTKTQRRSEDFRGKNYGTLMVGHFGATSDIDLDTTAKLNRYRALSAEASRSTEQEKEREINEEGTVQFSARDPKDFAANNTVSELMRLHGSEDLVLKKDIENALLKCLQRAYQLRQDLRKLGKKEAFWRSKRAELQRLLSRNAPFTALLRSRMTDNLSRELLD